MPRKKKTAGQLLAAKRKRHGGGRPAKPTACKKCGRTQPTARQAREHCKGKPRKERRKATVTIERIFEEAKVLEEVKLASGERLLKLKLQPHVILLTGFDKHGKPWESTMHTVDFALDDEGHGEAATKRMLKALGMRGLKDFFLAYSVRLEQLMGRFKK